MSGVNAFSSARTNQTREGIERERERERETETERERERETERQRQRQRQRDIDSDRQRERESLLISIKPGDNPLQRLKDTQLIWDEYGSWRW